MDDLFDKDITVINRYIDISTKKYAYKVSYIKGFWGSSKGVSIKDVNLIKSDELIARILMSQRGYQKPKDFQYAQNTYKVKDVNAMPVSAFNKLKVNELAVKDTGWTLKVDDYLVKGIVTDFTTIADLLENYADVIKITKIGVKDYGSEDMWHWAITGA